MGALAEKVGVSPRTIKHWEDMGIIEPNMRSEGGFRYYSDAYIYLCNLIKDLQLFNYSLVDIKMISDLFRYYLAIQQQPDSSPAGRKGRQAGDHAPGDRTGSLTKYPCSKPGSAAGRTC